MYPAPSQLYKYHVANSQRIDVAVARIARIVRHHIARDEASEIFIFLRLYCFLLGASAECRLQKLLHEPSGFLPAEREAIVAVDMQLEKWQKLVEMAFRKHYKVPKAQLSEQTLPHSAFSRYKDLNDLLKNELRPIIELRNKFAHGQWDYLLNSSMTAVSKDHMAAIKLENFLSLQFKSSLIGHLIAAINDLVVSKAAFERDFDERFKDIVNTRRNLQTRDYAAYAGNLREKYLSGSAMRTAAKPTE